MPDHFETCPGCNSLVLSDTAACPECGHQFINVTDSAEANQHERGVIVYKDCPECGDEVPAGLVRCWKCNAFMRNDVAETYKALLGHPQKITFSDLPPDQRTETIPPRTAKGGYARVLDVEEDEFTLQWEESGGPDFELNSTSQYTTDTGTTSSESVTETPSSEVAPAADKPEPVDSDPVDFETNADDLLSIALTQEREADVQKRERQAAMNRQRILMPCPACGVWLRVRKDQAGKTVRCRSCRAAVPVPEIRRKEKSPQQETAPRPTLRWIEDIRVHLITPSKITLKPGSLQDTFQPADAVFDSEGLHLIILDRTTKKKSLFSRSTSDDNSVKRAANREQIQQSGGFTQLPHGELHTIPTSALTSIRLAQPVRQAHESMFAGVPIFGNGLIAVYLPLQLDDGQQAFCSMPLHIWRLFDDHLRQRNIELPAEANGVPGSEVHSSPLCHYTQAKIESVRDLVYYKNDGVFELELTGYRCTSCGIAVSEAGRAKNKLGGAAGKSIAKAKCPNCSAKFGSESLFKISKVPETNASENAPSDSADSPADHKSEKSL